MLFPINFLSFEIGGMGAELLKAATAAGMGILAIKALARCRINPTDGNKADHTKRMAVKHVPSMLLEGYKKDFDVYVHPKYCTWYTPEDDPEWAKKLFLVSGR